MSAAALDASIDAIRTEIQEGTTIPFLGLGVFKGCTFGEGGPVPSTNDEIILSINNGRAMAPRLMVDYSRALMTIEQRKGRQHLEGMMNLIFSKPMQTPAITEALHRLSPSYIIDTNYDPTCQTLMEKGDFNLVVGIARITAENERYEIFRYDAAAKSYEKRESIDYALPILFKTMGTTRPEPTFIASDADFVDWLTEAMGGFALPQDLKAYRKGKKYLFLGFLFDRDTERMVGNEMTLDLEGGYVVLEGEPCKRAAQFMEKHNLVQIDQSLDAFTEELLAGIPA